MRFPCICAFMFKLYKVYHLQKLVLVSDPELAQIPHIHMNFTEKMAIFKLSSARHVQ